MTDGLRRGSAAALCMYLAICAGCGGNAPEARAPSSPPPQEVGAPADATSVNSAEAPAQAAPPPPPPGAPPTTPAPAASAQHELERSEAELNASPSDCMTACRALASMQRATENLCAIADGGDRGRCDDARRRLRAARERVTRACGSCTRGAQ
jgi:hypothetical protein